MRAKQILVFVEKILVVFSVIALGMLLFRTNNAIFYLLIGLPGLGIYYILVFPFLGLRSGELEHDSTLPGWLRIIVRILSGLGLAYGIAGFTLFVLHEITRSDLLTNACVVVLSVAVAHLIGYRKSMSPFSLRTLLRAGVLLIVMLLIALIFKHGILR